MDVRDKAAIVTGGGTGVGKATALDLARRGCAVLINYSRSQTEAEETAGEIEALGVKAVAIKADVADDTACRNMVKTAIDALGGLHVLVNNAGTTSFINHHDLDQVTDEVWDRIMAVNLKGAFQCARAAKEPIEASGGGEIVNVSSVAGLIGVGSSIPYACSKAALNNLTVMLARVMAPKIRVNGVAPGFISGRWLEKGLGDNYDAMKKAYERRLPAREICDPEDVADAIISLITGSDLVLGQTLVVDSGLVIMQP